MPDQTTETRTFGRFELHRDSEGRWIDERGKRYEIIDRQDGTGIDVKRIR